MPMETMSEATARLQAAGYLGNFVAVPGGNLRCAECAMTFAAADASIDEVVRFEGETDPADEAVLVAVSGPCAHRGIYTAAYGMYATAEDAAVLDALPRT